jgi:hypothetical protein
MTIRSVQTFACVAAALAAATSLLASTGPAEAAGGMACPPFLCNGTQLTGIRIDGNRSSALAAAVTLPSGEVVRLGPNASEQPRLQVAAKKGLKNKQRQFETLVRDKNLTDGEYWSLKGMRRR